MRMLPRLINQNLLQMGRILLVLAALPAPASDLTEKDLSNHLKFYTAIQELKTTFQQTKHLSSMNLDLKSDGRMTIKKPDDISWEILHPSPILVRLNKSEVKITNGDDTQIFKFQELSQDNMARGVGLLLPWLTLDVKALSEQYKMSQEADGQFLFEPKISSVSISKMKLLLKKNGHLERLTLYETSGDWMEIRFGQPTIIRKTQ